MKVGYHSAVVVSAGLAKSAKGTVSISLLFEVPTGECAGDRIRWDGWITTDTVENTARSLAALDWNGEISAKSIQALVGKKCQIKVDKEIDHEQKERFRIKFLNRILSLKIWESATAEECADLQSRHGDKIAAALADESKRAGTNRPATPGQYSPRQSPRQAPRAPSAPDTTDEYSAADDNIPFLSTSAPDAPPQSLKPVVCGVGGSQNDHGYNHATRADKKGRMH